MEYIVDPLWGDEDALTSECSIIGCSPWSCGCIMQVSHTD